MQFEKEILTALSTIQDPDLNQDIVSLGFVKHLNVNDGHVSLTLELTTPACPVKDHFKTQAKTLIEAIEGIKSVEVSLSAQKGANPLFQSSSHLKNVQSIIAVSSCKGGVGKSTVAVNLAYILSQLGAKVGLLDADVYGPSLPIMVKVEDPILDIDEQGFNPIEKDGVKLMSFGFLQTTSGNVGPAIMRGPMVSQIINQLLTQTHWGELDYLILDLPPGTGDIQITLSQLVPITAAIIVTTPQQVSLADVIKGIQMFDALQVPVVGVVENMSFFECSNCSTQHFIYGSGALEKLLQNFGYSNAFRLPLLKDVSKAGDSGKPAVLLDENSPFSLVFRHMAGTLAREVSRLIFQKVTPELKVTENKTLHFSNGSEPQITLSAFDLRSKCRCANCVEEFTGEKLVRNTELDPEVHPLDIKSVGNYAFGIQWSDGHSSLYPIEMLKQL